MEVLTLFLDARARVSLLLAVILIAPCCSGLRWEMRVAPLGSKPRRHQTDGAKYCECKAKLNTRTAHDYLRSAVGTGTQTPVWEPVFPKLCFDAARPCEN